VLKFTVKIVLLIAADCSVREMPQVKLYKECITDMDEMKQRLTNNNQLYFANWQPT